MGIPIKQVYDILKSNQAVLVHCASFAPMYSDVKRNTTPIENIINVINNQLAISCSTIVPGDTSVKRNYTGNMGVILLPNSEYAISHAEADGAGTGEQSRNLAQKDKGFTTIENFENAIVNRKDDQCNEICVYSYKVCGVFIDDLPVKFSDTYIEGNKELITYSFEEIFSKFSEQQLYFLREGKFYKIRNKDDIRDNMDACSIEEIYEGCI